ncbi:MAG: hypothetical protein ABIK26_05230 [Candidatus Omnitrophota bacterium]
MISDSMILNISKSLRLKGGIQHIVSALFVTGLSFAFQADLLIILSEKRDKHRECGIRHAINLVNFFLIGRGGIIFKHGNASRSK